jgi:hypothetical protein
MGMYSDNLSAQRTQWTYIYSGEELLPYARRLYSEFAMKEQTARESMARLPQNDERIEKFKKDIQTNGSLKEQCSVFQHEFQRNATKLYELGLGDVTFFGLTQLPPR